jgi:hypothetical protein
LLAPVGCIASLSEVVKHIAVLLLQRGNDGHNTFGKTTSRLALGAKAALAPKYTRADLSFSQVVSRLHTLDTYKGPQGFLPLENVAAGTRRFSMVAARSLAQQFTDLILNCLHLLLESNMVHGPIPHFVPPLKHQLGLGEEGFPNGLGFATALNKLLEIT